MFTPRQSRVKTPTRDRFLPVDTHEEEKKDKTQSEATRPKGERLEEDEGERAREGRGWE